ncbi:Putative RxLR effector [Phytophthora palmivora]|uniref:RxLR effector n=1 Tax=Phytophthora palmivora TaxID=4796 RepID=A0A2P4XYG3_9STRA|nr:Putative RxLR effector [Phytophthora palmivora]
MGLRWVLVVLSAAIVSTIVSSAALMSSKNSSPDSPLMERALAPSDNSYQVEKRRLRVAVLDGNSVIDVSNSQEQKNEERMIATGMLINKINGVSDRINKAIRKFLHGTVANMKRMKEALYRKLFNAGETPNSLDSRMDSFGTSVSEQSKHSLRDDYALWFAALASGISR